MPFPEYDWKTKTHNRIDQHMPIFHQCSPSPLNDKCIVYLFSYSLPRPTKPWPPVLYLYCAWCSVYHILGVGSPKMGPMSLKLKLCPYHSIVHLLSKFIHPLVNCLEVFIDRQTHPEKNHKQIKTEIWSKMAVENKVCQSVVKKLSVNTNV